MWGLRKILSPEFLDGERTSAVEVYPDIQVDGCDLHRMPRGGRFLPIALQHSFTMERISPKGSERLDPNLSGQSKGEVMTYRVLGETG